MTLRADSYSSTSEVKAWTRYMLDGQTTFNSTTIPTVTELEKFIDRASGVLNLALEGEGLTTPISNSTAKLACDDFVTARASAYVELVSRGAGYSEAEGSRTATFLAGLSGDATKFARDYRQGFVNMGVTQQNKLSDGLTFTGLDKQADRVDPDDTTLEQPAFERWQFDNDYSTDDD